MGGKKKEELMQEDKKVQRDRESRWGAVWQLELRTDGEARLLVRSVLEGDGKVAYARLYAKHTRHG